MRVLMLDGQTYPLIPLRTFRAQHGLPDAFSIAAFEAKAAAGLASLDQAGADLQALRQAVITALPARISRAHLLPAVEALQAVFEANLRRINPRVRLDEPEIDFAVAGFGDVCRAWAYALLAAPAPDFATVYTTWLMDSVRVAGQRHIYTHGGETWAIHILNTIYGRIGLEVTTPAAVHYVYDPVYACPAEGFMAGLLHEVAARLRNALV